MKHLRRHYVDHLTEDTAAVQDMRLQGDYARAAHYAARCEAWREAIELLDAEWQPTALLPSTMVENIR